MTSAENSASRSGPTHRLPERRLETRPLDAPSQANEGLRIEEGSIDPRASLSSMRASVVIPVRNARSTLGDQLAALLEQDFDDTWEVVVVDNGSDDGSREVVEDWQSRMANLRLVTEPQMGSSYARNTGARCAASERLLFCDADDVVSSFWVRAMTEVLDRFDLVGGALERELLNPPRVVSCQNATHHDGLSSALGHLPYASLANLGVRRHAFDAVGATGRSRTQTTTSTSAGASNTRDSRSGPRQSRSSTTGTGTR